MIKSHHYSVLGREQVGDLWSCHVGSTCFLCLPLVFDVISFHKSYTLWTWFYHMSLWMKCSNHHDNLSFFYPRSPNLSKYSMNTWEHKCSICCEHIFFEHMYEVHSCANLLVLFFFVYILFCWTMVIFNGKPKNTKVVKDSIVIDKRTKLMS